MHPLKLASRAYVNHGGSGDTYGSFRDDDQRDADEAMRAALLALAECDLSEEMIDLGWEDNQGTPDFERDFTSLLRFIANEGKSDV